MSGLAGPNGKITNQWAQIAQANGLHNPYGVDNAKEVNHWQLPPQPLEKTPQLLASLKEARATGNWSNVWSAYGDQGPETVRAAPATATSQVPQDPRQIVFNKLTWSGLSPQAALISIGGPGGARGVGCDPSSYNASVRGGSIR